MLEVHGKVGCPFAWRVRFAAYEKRVPYQWIPYNVPHPDARVQRDNPHHRSPLVVHEGLTLVESLVIDAYVDEAFPGRPLQAATAADRARARMLTVSLHALDDVLEGHTDERSMTRLLEVLADIDRALAEGGRPWLQGDAPGLFDIALLPLLAGLDKQGHKISPRFAALAAYWSRGQQHDGFRRTAPAVAKMEVGV